MKPMLFRARTIAAMLTLGLAVGIIGSLLDFGGWAWYAAAVGAVLIVTLTDRERFYGSDHGHHHALH